MVITLPLWPVIALAVKVSSDGPVFFRQERVGKAGKVFEILKFRSMTLGAEKDGPQITRAGDKRITAIGALLRQTKLDELPQFWNVLKGEMSLVGPRPEVPKYVALYTPEQAKVLSIAPGVTDYATVAFRHEEELLGRQVDAELYYIHELMPRKLVLNLKYLSDLSLWTDVRLLCVTVAAIFERGKAELGISENAE